MKQIIIFLIIYILAFGSTFVLADYSSSTNFIIQKGVVDSGGSTATSSNYNLRTSVGEPATGISTSTSFILKGGFLNFVVSTTSTPTVSPPGGGGTPGSVSVGGGGGFFGFLTPPKKPIPPTKGCIDFNGDGNVDIVDLSIILFHYNKKDSNLGCYDINQNGIVDFPDISILMYYWTG